MLAGKTQAVWWRCWACITDRQCLSSVLAGHIYQLILSSLSQMLVQILAVDELQILEMAAAQSGAAGVGQGIVNAIQVWCAGAYPSLHP